MTGQRQTAIGFLIQASVTDRAVDAGTAKAAIKKGGRLF